MFKFLDTEQKGNDLLSGGPIYREDLNLPKNRKGRIVAVSDQIRVDRGQRANERVRLTTICWEELSTNLK